MNFIPGATFTVGGPSGESWQIVRELSSGGFGKTFEVRRLAPTPDVAVIKVPHPHVAADPVWAAKFERENRILANVDHRNVVKHRAQWNFKGVLAIVQAMVEGAQKLTAYVQATPADAPSLMLQALYALRALHDGTDPRIVHRDLSPGNLLVDVHGTLKVIDFGLAKEDPRETATLTQTGVWFGTKGCMAPEQEQNSKDVDVRADIFALGKTFAAALQGRTPGHAAPHLLPEPWKTLLTKMSEHDAEDRYQTPHEALSAAMNLFAAHGVAIAHFADHCFEWQNKPAILGWPALCQAYFLGLPDIGLTDIELLDEVHPSTFAGLNSGALFDKIDAGSAVASLSNKSADYDDADAIGKVIRKMFPALDVARKHRAFERVVRVALDFHRYSVMGQVRSIFREEKDPAMCAQLLAILNHLDPTPVNTIHGHGIVPGR